MSMMSTVPVEAGARKKLPVPVDSAVDNKRRGMGAGASAGRWARRRIVWSQGRRAKVVVGEFRQPTEMTWVFRPDPARDRQRSRASDGARVYGVGTVGDDGRVEVVLHDGTRVRALPGEVVAE
jgi:hypothetical protein